MDDLKWKADGIGHARTAGGVELESYLRPGFTGGTAVRRVGQVGGAGFETAETDFWDQEDEDLGRLTVPRP